MNPMQGPWNTGGSSSGVNQADGELIYSAETSSMLNPVENEFPNNSMSSGRPTSTSSSSHGVQNYNGWRFGESSSVSESPDQVSSIGMKTNHQLSQDGAGHQFVGYGSEGRQLGFNGMMVHGGAHAGSHIGNGASFLRGSSSNTMPQHVNMSMDMDMDGDGYGAQTSGVVIRQSNRGASLGSSIQAAGESSSGPSSSFGGWGPSCKRKALEGPYSGETPDCSFQTENVGLSQYGASSSLSLATPSQSSPNVANHFNRTEQMFGFGGGRAVAANAFHSTRNTDTLSRPGRRLNSRQPEEPVAFNISHSGSSVRPNGSLQQNLPLNSLFVDPQDVRSTSVATGSSTGGNQMNIVHLPALTRNIHQFTWDASFSSRASNSSGIGMPAEQFRPQWEAPRNNQEQPMFPPSTDMRNPVHDQSVWSFTRGNPGSSIDSTFVPRAGPSSDFHAQQPIPTWIPPPQSASLDNSSRTSDLFAWSLFPSVESQSASRGASLPVLPTGPSVSSNEVVMPSSSNSRSHRSQPRRSGLLLERQNDLHQLRNLQRSLAADGYGRNQIISEIRQALSAVRRGENLRAEDYMVFDQLIYQGMTEVQDRHRELRLDIDNMSYEELMALEERIGDVNTGLREEVILKTMKQHKLTSSSAELHQDIQPCCICQEQYAEGDDLGTLECGHQFHTDCIKQWVMLKNHCPICKTKALTT